MEMKASESKLEKARREARLAIDIVRSATRRPMILEITSAGPEAIETAAAMLDRTLDSLRDSIDRLIEAAREDGHETWHTHCASCARRVDAARLAGRLEQAEEDYDSIAMMSCGCGHRILEKRDRLRKEAGK